MIRLKNDIVIVGLDYKQNLPSLNYMTDDLLKQKDNKILKLEKEILKWKRAVKNQRYGLVWLDVPEAFEDDVENKLPILEEVPEKAIPSKDDQPTHILIEGDNYHALTCLNYTHKGKVDVIYIDPPYNTGQDGFRYKDKRILDQYPDGTEVPKDHPFRHSYWLSFMKKRLELAKDLLTTNGLIFISIDDNELAQLKLLCDEIFLERNFIAVQIWRGMHTVRNSSKEFNHNTEYILTYARNLEALIESGKQETYIRIARDKTSSYPYDDNDGNGPYKLDPISARNFYTPYTYTFKNGLQWSAPKGSYPRYSVENLQGMEARGEINLDGKEPRAKRYLKNVQEGVPPNTLIPSEEVGFNKDATTFLRKMFEDKVFDQPKPVELIKYLLSIKNKKRDDNKLIVLDFFAGSGTTGQAVMELNKEDDKERQFILVTNDENGIMTDVCRPRIEKVIKGFNDHKPLGGSVKYYKTSFVGKHNILDVDDKDQVQLAQHAGEMLAIAENTLSQIEKTDYWQFFESKGQITAVYFREEQDKFDDFVKKVLSQKKSVTVYVFSWQEKAEIFDFENNRNISLKTIPQPILEIYKQIYNII